MMSSEGLRRSQVEAVVGSQFARLRKDPVVGPRFAHIGPGAEHEARIADFWWANLGGASEQRRSFDMLAKHRALALTEESFAIWFGHLQASVDEHLSREEAARWMKRAQDIGVQLTRYTLGGGHPSRLMQIGSKP